MASGASETLVLGGDTADLMAKLRALEAQLKRLEKEQLPGVAKAGKAMGGQGAMGFLEFARGAEDFASQINNGIGPALRASTNNIASMATMMGGPLVGAIGTFAAIAGGLLIPRLVEMVTGQSDLNKEYDDAVKYLKDMGTENQLLMFAEEDRADAKERRTEGAKRRTLAEKVAAEKEALVGTGVMPWNAGLGEEGLANAREHIRMGEELERSGLATPADRADLAGMYKTFGPLIDAQHKLAEFDAEVLLREGERQRKKGAKQTKKDDKRMSPQEIRLEEIRIQQDEIQAQKTEAEDRARDPKSKGGANITGPEKRAIDAEFGNSLRDLAAEAKHLTSALRAQRLEEEKKKRGQTMPPTNRQAAAAP